MPFGHKIIPVPRCPRHFPASEKLSLNSVCRKEICFARISPIFNFQLNPDITLYLGLAVISKIKAREIIILVIGFFYSIKEMAVQETKEIQKLRSLIEEGLKIVVFTGAGISTESGISDYRSKGGIWDRFQPITIQEFLADEGKRREYWRRKKEMYAAMRNAQPNIGHLAIARLERSGKLMGVITQNIDGLHQKAGNQKILELHGTNREVLCLQCHKIDPFEPVYQRLLAGEEIPLCQACGGLLKPNTISFGQELDPAVLEQAVAWMRSADLVLAVGSTLIVEPAASLPRLAQRSGAKLVILNRDPTPLDSVATLVIQETAGPVLQAAVLPLSNECQSTYPKNSCRPCK